MSLSLCPRWRNKMYLFIYFIYSGVEPRSLAYLHATQAELYNLHHRGGGGLTSNIVRCLLSDYRIKQRLSN